MNLPQKDAHQVLERMRGGTDIATIVNHVKAGDLLLQMAVLPETRFRYTLPYKSEMPEEYIEDSPYLDSLIYEASSLYSGDGSSQQFVHMHASPLSESSFSDYKEPYFKPFHAAEVVDTRLFDVDISQWTNVCDNNALMRDLLSEWLHCEYHFTAALQKDLFFEDMASQRDDFCSSLLVNVVLGYACVRRANKLPIHTSDMISDLLSKAPKARRVLESGYIDISIHCGSKTPLGA